MTTSLSWRFGPIDPAAIRTLAEALNDPNPIHLDARAVAAAGLGDRVINQGPANLAYVLNMLEQANLEPTVLKARFTANVRAGDSVVAHGQVATAKNGELTCTFSLDIEGGPPALSGVVSCRSSAAPRSDDAE